MPKYIESDDDAEEGGHPRDDNGSKDEYVDKEVVEKMSAYHKAPDAEDKCADKEVVEKMSAYLEALDAKDEYGDR